MTRSLVSVVVPTYNRAYCLARTLDSILCQTHSDFEVILVDDGSTDDTRGMVRSGYGQDARIKYDYQENRGVSAARNRGFQLAQGNYVALLDSDDTWEPWKLQLQLACLRHCPEIGMVWTDMVAIGPDGKILNRNYLRSMYGAYRWFGSRELFSRFYPLACVAPDLTAVVGNGSLSTGDIFSQMVMGNLVHTSTVLLRRERLSKVRGFNEELRVSGEDYDFHLRTCREGPVGFVDLATIHYQTGMPDRLTRPVYKLHAATNCLRTILPALKNDRNRIRLPPAMIRSRLAEVHDWIGEVSMEMGLAANARRHLLASLRQDPMQPRVLRLLALSALPFGLSVSARKLFRSVKSRFRRAPSHLSNHAASFAEATSQGT
jgi:GT2 family glycosyltransferase